MQIFTLAALAALASSASAHFTLNYPETVGFDEDNEPTAPCGGFSASDATNRTLVPLDGTAPFAIYAGHPSAQVIVKLALSTDPTTNADFNITVVPQFTENGLGDFCFPSVNWAAAAGSPTEGQNATVQVAYSGGDGVLYQCAAIQFSSSAATSSSACTNGTNVSAGPSSSTSTSTSSNSTLTSTSSTSASASGTASTSASAASGTSTGTTSGAGKLSVGMVAIAGAIAGLMM
ncbi:hypothetical protein YB2330_005309 [Saitoella coloradoensis]